MSLIDSTLAGLLITERVSPKNSFEALARAVKFESGSVSTRASARLGTGTKGDPYAFADHLVTQYGGIIVTSPVNGFEKDRYVVVVRILTQFIAVLIRAPENENEPGTVIISSADIGHMGAEFGAVIKKWKEL